MSAIIFKNITKKYAGTSAPAVDSVSFTVPSGSTCVLVGTSGSGKTTLLRMVNRLIEPGDGEILIEDKNILQENPVQLRRRIGYVIQQVGLFPHMNIAENVRVTAEIAGGWTKQRLSARVDELLELVGLPPAEYRKRFPRQLSGGQQQRVGLARALATDPAILLMDEPFGALDAITRKRMQDELLHIQRSVQKTILFVSHDIEEAFKLGDQVAVMAGGKLVQIGSPVDLLVHPADDFVRQLVGGDSVMRYLQYLHVARLIEANPDTENTRPEHCSTCVSDTPLLEAMVQLLETNAPALRVLHKDTQDVEGYVTLEQITQKIKQVHHDSTSPAKVAL